MMRPPLALLFLFSAIVPGSTLHAQSLPPGSPAERAPVSSRLRFEIAVGPAFEVATAGERPSQRAVLAVPTLAIRVASWLDYTAEGHLSRHVSPVSGNAFGIVPIGLRVHRGTRTQFHLAAGAGLAWTDLKGLHGVEQRRNFLTQIGVGITRVGANRAGVSLEARFFHLSNLHAAPPNLGMEMFALLVGYRLPR
jgi:hypothetical protein